MNPAGIGTRTRRYGRAIRGRALGSLVRVATRAKVAALTFDDGPDPVYTPRLLDLLAERKAKATFFVIGRNAERYPEIVRRIGEEGHLIANHTWDHSTFPGLTHSERTDQLARCAAATQPWSSPWFRPPKTLQTLGSFMSTRRAGYDVAAWGVNVEDWLAHTADTLSSRLSESVRPGSIVLLHDSVWDPADDACADRSATIEAVGRLCDHVGADMCFVTLEELIQSGRPVRNPWFVETDDDW